MLYLVLYCYCIWFWKLWWYYWGMFLLEYFCFLFWVVSNNFFMDVWKFVLCSLVRKFWIMDIGFFICKIYCLCDLGFLFWLICCGSFYLRRCCWFSEYCLFWGLLVVVYNRIMYEWRFFHWSFFCIISYPNDIR